MKKPLKRKLGFIILSCICLCSYRGLAQKTISIYFSGYDLTVNEIPKLGDTLRVKKSSSEFFKFIFYATKGECYCERFVNNKLYERGYYENSLDTLKRYISARIPKGEYIPIKVQKYFEPLKNGEWIVYNNGKQKKESYFMGVLKR